MTTTEVAEKLVALCQEGKHLEAINELYAEDIVTIEACDSPEMPAQQEGIEAVRAKNQWWMDSHEVHGGEVKGPYVGEHEFAVYFKYDVTYKPENQRMEMEEMALYTVKDGKIAREQFFYNMPGM